MSMIPGFNPGAQYAAPRRPRMGPPALDGGMMMPPGGGDQGSIAYPAQPPPGGFGGGPQPMGPNFGGGFQPKVAYPAQPPPGGFGGGAQPVGPQFGGGFQGTPPWLGGGGGPQELGPQFALPGGGMSDAMLHPFAPRNRNRFGASPLGPGSSMRNLLMQGGMGRYV